jgi:glutamine amidotransferase
MIAIIDYGLGNVKALAAVYTKLNIHYKIVRQSNDLIDASKIILPGVGAFDYAMQRLEQSGLKNELAELVLKDKIPVLGICVGMQMLANTSEEGKLPGLGWIDGTVKRFKITEMKSNYYIPHMGWNDISVVRQNNLLHDLDESKRFYFLHSYYFQCNNINDKIAVTNYGLAFDCVVNHENVYGVQFHPEKSHNWGVQILKNFAEL